MTKPLFGPEFDRQLLAAFKPPEPRGALPVDKMAALLTEARKTGPDSPLPETRKLGHRLLISEDVAMDAGLIPDTRPKYVREPVSWRLRLRSAVVDRVRGVREAVGFWIAGHDPRSRDD